MDIEKQVDRDVSVEETTYEVGICPWCSQEFDPENADELYKNAKVNRVALFQSIFKKIRDKDKRAIEKTKIREEAILDKDLKEVGSVPSYDLTQIRVRGDTLKEIVHEAVEEVSMVSDNKRMVCPDCAKSIMGVGDDSL